MSGHAYDHGHTLAGWVGVAVATAGGTVTGLGVISWRPGIWLGLAVTAAAVLITWAMHLTGWGKAPGLRPVTERGLRVRDGAARAGHPDCLGCALAGRRGTPARPGPASGPGVPAARTGSPADLAS
ncbi:HGxxPAAW family protein [Streptomyces uncialis]|uniref:HGxxPAAW family protein n=1 Tax=Streptomyces uncialis TaxID=1048205 RepID=UPI0033E24E9C